MTSEMVLLVETLTMEQDRKAARQIWPTDTVERRQILELAENTAALWETIEMALVQLQNCIKCFDYNNFVCTGRVPDPTSLYLPTSFCM
jgi:hypothetical protein